VGIREMGWWVLKILDELDIIEFNNDRREEVRIFKERGDDQ